MTSEQRTPPRFVPTLTAMAEVALPREGQETVSEIDPGDSGTTAVPAGGTSPVQSSTSTPSEVTNQETVGRALTDADALRLEEHLLHRILQRIDLSLEERLTDVVSVTVQEQLDAMVPRLRSEIDAVLRALVIEALAHEFAETPGAVHHFESRAVG